MAADGCVLQTQRKDAGEEGVVGTEERGDAANGANGNGMYAAPNRITGMHAIPNGNGNGNAMFGAPNNSVTGNGSGYRSPSSSADVVIAHLPQSSLAPNERRTYMM